MYFKTSFISKNYVGLIRNITKEIFKSGINIEKSQMIITTENILIYNTFTSLNDTEIMNSISKKYNEDDINRLFNIQNSNSNQYYKKINMTSFDNTGIIHDISNIITNNNMDIINLNTNVNLAPFTSSRIFDMNMVINMPENIDNDIITELLTPINIEYNPELEIIDLF